MPTLLRLEGNGWLLEIAGALPALPPFISIAPNTSAMLAGQFEALKILDRSSEQLAAVVPGAPICPIFFEAVRYDIYFETEGEKPAMVKLPPTAEKRRVKDGREHYSIDFGSNVGFVDFLIESDVGPTKLTIEVFARKVDYRTDYIAMREDVSTILRNLAMTVNAKTYGLAKPAYDHRPTLLEWFALLKAHFSDFLKLANSICKHPHTSLNRNVRRKDTDRARRVGRHAVERALRKNNSGPVLPSLGISLPRKIDERVSFLTFDTPENRYFKAVLKSTYNNMRALSRVEKTDDEDGETEAEKKFFASIRPELKLMESELEAVLRAPFLREVGEGTAVRPTSMVFHKNPIYSRFDKLARLLNGGLSFAGSIVPVGVKNTALLYEYWCFLKIVDLLRKRLDLQEQSFVKYNRLRTTVTLKKGKSAAILFLHAATGKKVYVFYNRLFERLPTIAQKPDNVIQIASQERFYVFDAKYRIQFDKDYVRQYGGPGPTTDDINTMHRYRDAIAIPHPENPEKYKSGAVEGAVVLFPYPSEDAYQEHWFYRSIDSVEIGGIPFLPNATALMDQKLQKLLQAQLLSNEEMQSQPENG